MFLPKKKNKINDNREKKFKPLKRFSKIWVKNKCICICVAVLYYYIFYSSSGF